MPGGGFAGFLRRSRYRADGWWGDQTVDDMFRANVTRDPTRPALVDAPNRGDFSFGELRRLTYADLSHEVDRIAGVLLAQGVGKSDILLVQMPNICELVALYFACARIGAVISPIPVQYRAHELSQIAAILEPRAFVCCTQVKGSNHLRVAGPLLNARCRVFTFGPNPPAESCDLSTATGGSTALQRHSRKHKHNADEVFTICWTSGTTGAPKGVPRTHNQWMAIAPATYESVPLRDGEILLNPFPLINMASIGGITMSWLRVAGVMVLHHPFDAGVYLQQIATERPAFTIAPPAILNTLLQDETLLARVDLSSLRAIGSGSAPLAPAMVRGFQERHNIMVINLFGSNEGMSLVSAPDIVPDPDERASFFPRSPKFRSPYRNKDGANLETQLMDLANGKLITKHNVAGELQIRGPTLFDAYYKAPEQTAHAFTRDGFFKTGDLFQIEGGGRFFRFVGRYKDLIIRGGFNISPEEIDQLLGGHPQLAEAATFSLPDPVLGERIGLAIVPRSTETVELKSITDFLKERGLAHFKLPERLFVVDALPRNSLNKVMRQEVRERALAAEQGAQVT